MPETTPICLAAASLPANLPIRTGFVKAVNHQLRKLHVQGEYLPQRFFGYYFQEDNPICVSGGWTVLVNRISPLLELLDQIKHTGEDPRSIVAKYRDVPPRRLLVHDRLDGSCWLWEYFRGLQFVKSSFPANAQTETSKRAA